MDPQLASLPIHARKPDQTDSDSVPFIYQSLPYYKLPPVYRLPVTMRACAKRPTGENGEQTRCTKQPPPNKQYCKEHYQDYRRQTDAYKKATTEADELEKPVKRLMDRGAVAIQQTDLVAMNEEIVRSYAECLERAIKGREEHHREFFGEGAQPVA